MGKDLKGKELGVGISQRKDGIYQARYTDRWGKRKTIYNSDVSAIRRQLAGAVTDNERFTSIRDSVTLDAWFKNWMTMYKERSVRPNTKRMYTYVYSKSISPYVGGRLVSSLMKSDIQALVDKAADDGYGYEYQSKVRAILRDMLQRAIEDQLLINNPVSGVKLRADRVSRAKSLTIAEQQVFFEYSKDTFYDNLFNVAVNTGLRPGELFALRVEDINLEEGYINVDKTLVYQKYLMDDKVEFHVEPPKTKQSCRHVPINSTCRKYIKKQISLKKMVSTKRPMQQNDYLFVTRLNTPLSIGLYSEAIKAVVKRINKDRAYEDQFAPFSGHTFRHTFATRCFESGVDAKVVQSYLGHASLKMTMDLYTHVTAERAKSDIEKIVKFEG